MCDDRDAIAFILARKSHLAADMGNPAEALDAAEAALDAVPHKVGRIAAVAMTFAGQAHALRGKADCERSYAMAHELTERLESDPASPCALFLDHSYVEVYRARSLAFLGEYGAAVESFQRAISSLPRGYRRDRGVYLAREAGAHLGQGDVEQACAVGVQALAHWRRDEIRPHHRRAEAPGYLVGEIPTQLTCGGLPRRHEHDVLAVEARGL
jgi:tetratricopeptide (TPR) repeat protein